MDVRPRTTRNPCLQQVKPPKSSTLKRKSPKQRCTPKSVTFSQDTSPVMPLQTIQPMAIPEPCVFIDLTQDIEVELKPVNVTVPDEQNGLYLNMSHHLMLVL